MAGATRRLIGSAAWSGHCRGCTNWPGRRGAKFPPRWGRGTRRKGLGEGGKANGLGPPRGPPSLRRLTRLLVEIRVRVRLRAWGGDRLAFDVADLFLRHRGAVDAVAAALQERPLAAADHEADRHLGEWELLAEAVGEELLI